MVLGYQPTVFVRDRHVPGIPYHYRPANKKVPNEDIMLNFWRTLTKVG